MSRPEGEWVVTFDEYRHAFEPRFWLERTDDGVLTVRWQPPGRGDDLQFGGLIGNPPSLQVAESVWTTIGADSANRAVVITGTGSAFWAIGSGGGGHKAQVPGLTADVWSRIMRSITRGLDAFLDIPTVLIGAANGPAMVHAEYLAACDIVIASEEATFSDQAHYVNDLVPGDGSNIVWPLLLGWRRGADFLLTGKTLTAHEALELGVVREVVPHDELLPRCHELARELSTTSDATRRLTALSLRQRLRRMLHAELHHTAALEGLTFLDRNVAQ